MARPKGSGMVTCDELIPEWEEIALNCYSQGMSDVEVRRHLARPNYKILGNSTWTRLMENPRFAETIKRGRLISAAWWEEQGRKGLLNQRFNSALWYMNMKNRFGWRDKQPDEVSHTVHQVAPIDTKQLIELVEAARATKEKA